jgi:16S rRNA (cytosine1402-N4)-methyltransferase
MKHIPVLENDIVDAFAYLSDKSDLVFVDGTVGEGNHSIAIAERYKKKDTITKFIEIDKDQSALEETMTNIKKAGLSGNFILVQDDFKNIANILADDNIDKIDGALLDLGVSSMQLDQKNRGFSFSDLIVKLDMRMDQSQKLNAILVLNKYPEEKLEKILREYGEEKFSRKIAKNICITRKNKQIETVGDLIYILEKSIPLKFQKTSRVHFATKTFQAVRIEVNGELEGLKEAINDFVSLLKPDGRLAIITFHSLEDRIVKNTFRELASDCICPQNAPVCNCSKVSDVKLITKKPIIATEKEIEMNPRSRSAKLRLVEKLF